MSPLRRYVSLSLLGSKWGAPQRVSTLMSPTDKSQPCPTQPSAPPESYSTERSGAIPRPLGSVSGYDKWAPPSLLACGGSTRDRPSVASGNVSPSTRPSPISAGVSCGSRASVVLLAPPNGSSADAVVVTTLPTNTPANKTDNFRSQDARARTVALQPTSRRTSDDRSPNRCPNADRSPAATVTQ